MIRTLSLIVVAVALCAAAGAVGYRILVTDGGEPGSAAENDGTGPEGAGPEGTGPEGTAPGSTALDRLRAVFATAEPVSEPVTQPVSEPKQRPCRRPVAKSAKVPAGAARHDEPAPRPTEAATSDRHEESDQEPARPTETDASALARGVDQPARDVAPPSEEDIAPLAPVDPFAEDSTGDADSALLPRLPSGEVVAEMDNGGNAPRPISGAVPQRRTVSEEALRAHAERMNVLQQRYLAVDQQLARFGQE